MKLHPRNPGTMARPERTQSGPFQVKGSACATERGRGRRRKGSAADLNVPSRKGLGPRWPGGSNNQMKGKKRRKGKQTNPKPSSGHSVLRHNRSSQGERARARREGSEPSGTEPARAGCGVGGRGAKAVDDARSISCGHGLISDVSAGWNFSRSVDGSARTAVPRALNSSGMYWRCQGRGCEARHRSRRQRAAGLALAEGRGFGAIRFASSDRLPRFRVRSPDRRGKGDATTRRGKPGDLMAVRPRTQVRRPLLRPPDPPEPSRRPGGIGHTSWVPAQRPSMGVMLNP